MKAVYLTFGVSALALIGAVAFAQPAQPISAEAARCAALAGVKIAPDTVIESAEWFAQGGTAAGTRVTAPFCRAIGVATPTPSSRIGFEVWLPPASAWNGKFRGEGSGGSAGSLSPGAMREALMAGFATMSTDNGHLTDPKDPLGGSGQRWAYKQPEKMIDWAWRATHLSTVAAKQVVKNFYGKPSSQNYFVSCSAGGHHALMEATRFPEDYDGFVAGAAPWKWSALMFGHTWNANPVLRDITAVTAQSAAILNRRMIAACDEVDGIKDGVISDPRRCTVDPKEFQCREGQSDDCLTPVQVAAAQHIYRGARKADGTWLMPGQVRGSEAGWPSQNGGTTPGGSAFEFWKLTAFQDPNFRNVDFDFEKDSARALAVKVGNATLGATYDTTPNLDAFRKRGGKFIFFQGWADSIITPLADVDYTNQVIARYGQSRTDEFFRFFLLPGMGHCSGGPGFSHIGGATGAPIKDNADHDMVKALDRWVTTGEAPSLFIGAKMEGRTVLATRPICRYPLEARYLGKGSINEAANFACRLPDGKLPPPPM